MSPQQTTIEVAASATERFDIRSLADVMSRTLPQGGMDRMTWEKVEEILAVTALTAHI